MSRSTRYFEPIPSSMASRRTATKRERRRASLALPLLSFDVPDRLPLRVVHCHMDQLLRISIGEDFAVGNSIRKEPQSDTEDRSALFKGRMI